MWRMTCFSAQKLYGVFTQMCRVQPHWGPNFTTGELCMERTEASSTFDVNSPIPNQQVKLGNDINIISACWEETRVSATWCILHPYDQNQSEKIWKATSNSSFIFILYIERIQMISNAYQVIIFLGELSQDLVIQRTELLFLPFALGGHPASLQLQTIDPRAKKLQTLQNLNGGDRHVLPSAPATERKQPTNNHPANQPTSQPTKQPSTEKPTTHEEQTTKQPNKQNPTNQQGWVGWVGVDGNPEFIPIKCWKYIEIWNSIQNTTSKRESNWCPLPPSYPTSSKHRDMKWLKWRWYRSQWEVWRRTDLDYQPHEFGRFWKSIMQHLGNPGQVWRFIPVQKAKVQEPFHKLHLCQLPWTVHIQVKKDIGHALDIQAIQNSWRQNGCWNILHLAKTACKHKERNNLWTS